MTTIYTDPYSGIEIIQLVQADQTVGVCYDPRKTLMPIPWSSRCPHCRAGRQRDLSIHTKREIKMLLSGKTVTRRQGGKIHKTVVYTLPTNATSIELSHKVLGKKHVFRARKEGKILVITSSPEAKPSYLGDLRQWQSPILHRCIRLLASARKATFREISVCLQPLASLPKEPRRPGGRRLACRDIDWSTYAVTP